jgi:hypothetical protein
MAIDRVTATVPLLHTQLGFPVSGSTDCAVRTAQSAIEFGTWGQKSPPPPELRPLMGAPAKGGTSMPQALRGIRAFGIEPIKIGPRNRGPIATVENWLRLGHFVAVYGNNGAVIDGWRELAGSKTYRGGHAIGIYGIEGGQTLSFDPLYDGRRANIPKGPTMVPFDMIAAFTGSSYGTGRASAYAVPLDAVLAATANDLQAANAALAECEANPGDCSDCERALTASHDETEAAQAHVARLQQQVAGIHTLAQQIPPLVGAVLDASAEPVA